jgi:lactate permease
LDTVLAATPLVIILTLMAGFRWSGTKAGAVGWLTALLIAGLRFGANAQLLLWAQIEGIFRAGYVLYIIWGALFFFRVTEADGTLSAMSEILRRVAPGRTLQLMLLAWGFGSFLQGVGGYGVPVAVVAPMLVGLGFPALDAVVITSLGISWSISFGSLGASYEALISTIDINGAVLAPWMAALLGVVCFQCGFVVLWMGRDKTSPWKELVPALSMALGMSATHYLAARVGLPNLATVLGGLAGLGVGAFWAGLRRRSSPAGAQPLVPAKQTLRHLLPYLILITIIMLISFVPFLNTALNRWVLRVDTPQLHLRNGSILPAGKTRAISVFGNPGAQLIYAGVLTVWLAIRQGRLPEGSKQRIRSGVLRSGAQSTFGILTLMTMATTMQMSNMVSQLATAMASFAGQFFPLVAPFIGALGAFMTGSNTNSNVLFGAFQLQVAQTLGLYAPFVLAIHNAGAAVGSVFSPAKIIVGCSTVGLSGQESDAMRRTIQTGVIMVAVVAVVGFIIARFVPLPAA